PLQIARQPRRAVALHVLGRGAEDAAHRKELFRDQLFRARRKDLQRAVETFLDRVDHGVVDDHVEDDLRITGLEFLQHVRQVAEHEAGQGVHALAPAPRGRDLAHLIDDLVGAADELGANAQEGEAELRELDAARVAVKERRADEAFKLLDARRDDRAREPHLARRLGEAARLGDAHEGIDRGKAVHACGILRLAAQGAAPSGTRLPSSVGISSLTVGWMCMARSMILYEASAAMTSTSEWTISSPSMQRSAAPRMRSLSASSSATGSDPRSTV